MPCSFFNPVPPFIYFPGPKYRFDLFSHDPQYLLIIIFYCHNINSQFLLFDVYFFYCEISGKEETQSKRGHCSIDAHAPFWQSPLLFTAIFSYNFNHIQTILYRHIIRYGISCPECKSSMPCAPPDHIMDTLKDPVAHSAYGFHPCRHHLHPAHQKNPVSAFFS